MRPAVIILSLMAGCSLAVPFAEVVPKSIPDALAADTLFARSADAEMPEDMRMFLSELDKRETNGGDRMQAASFAGLAIVLAMANAVL